MKCAVNYARIQQRYAQNGDTIIAFVDHLQCLSMREYFQYGADRLMQFDSGTGEMIRFYIDRYTQEIEPDEDYTVNAYYAMVRDLCGYGWDPEDHLWRDSVFDDFPPDKNSAAVCLPKKSPFMPAKCAREWHCGSGRSADMQIYASRGRYPRCGTSIFR